LVNQSWKSGRDGILSLHGKYSLWPDILWSIGNQISTPPKALHAILLGHGTHLLNAFARLEKEQKEKKKKDDGEERRGTGYWRGR